MHRNNTHTIWRSIYMRFSLLFDRIHRWVIQFIRKCRVWVYCLSKSKCRYSRVCDDAMHTNSIHVNCDACMYVKSIRIRVQSRVVQFTRHCRFV